MGYTLRLWKRCGNRRRLSPKKNCNVFNLKAKPNTKEKSAQGKEQKNMGVSVREKNKGSGEWWVFIRHAGERAAQKIGGKETAEDVKAEILKEIRTGRFDIAALKAARAPATSKEEKPTSPTLRKFFDGTMVPLW